MKRTGYGLLLLLCGGLAACALFLGALSIWVGIHHQARAGSWVPILAGAFAVALVLVVSFRLFRHLFERMKSPESIDL
ncbi:MAG: hypothetical protein JXL84_13680 [Deltaproteobacteria bacterium]|nr:hypothetical protein [Deltaproteobacteria bacterium]